MRLGIPCPSAEDKSRNFMDGVAEYYGQSNLHPLALAAVLILSLSAFAVQRRQALIPLFIAATAAPMSQRLVIGGADFTLLRVLLLAYLARMVLRNEEGQFKWNRIDNLVLLWTISGTAIMTLHYGNIDAFINRAGWSYDILLTYFVGRYFLREWDDVLCLSKAISYLSVPIAGAFAVEWATRYNMFSIMGGVPSETILRDGRLRCQGPFAHPILAGTFWAACLPMIWMLWTGAQRNRRLCVIGTFSALVIVAASASSTPVLSVMIAIFGVSLFRWRRHRTRMWVAAIVVAALLHFVLMDNPVWHLMARAGVVGGSTGWHRFIIFDAFVRNFGEWYISGESDPLSWGIPQMRDITNQYILEGLRGGLLTLTIFVLMIISCFKNIGRLLSPPANPTKQNPASEWAPWLMGVALLVHVVTFFGVSYFGQMTTILYIQLALIGSMTAVGKALSDSSITPRTQAAHRPSPRF